MTNDVEQLIISNEHPTKLTQTQWYTYVLYEELWKFIIFAKDIDFTNLVIKLYFSSLNNCGKLYKNEGINYQLISNKGQQKWQTYYEGCNKYIIDSIFLNNFNINLLFKLLSFDGFNISVFDEINQNLVVLEISKEKIEEKIEETFLKNQILKLEK